MWHTMRSALLPLTWHAHSELKYSTDTNNDNHIYNSGRLADGVAAAKIAGWLLRSGARKMQRRMFEQMGINPDLYDEAVKASREENRTDSNTPPIVVSDADAGMPTAATNVSYRPNMPRRCRLLRWQPQAQNHGLTMPDRPFSANTATKPRLPTRNGPL